MQISTLPYLDEHATTIEADVDDVWPVLLETLTRTRPGTASYARAVGCPDWMASGPRPLAEGSTVPGFRVVTAVPPAELVIAGRHRFATYGVAFRLERVAAGRSRLRIESRADFPGLAGGVYRLLVVGSGGHVVAVRNWLSATKRRAEA